MKIGIITHYYESINYGGNLQAYALCRFLNQNGFDSEQICYCLNEEKKRAKTPVNIMKAALSSMLVHTKQTVNTLFYKKQCRHYQKTVRERRNRFAHFHQELIPHSEEVYSDRTLRDSIKNYTVFITGSDQVWNFNMFRPGFFLGFVPSSYKKLSYAASVAKSGINDTQREYLQKVLADFTAISVRERSAITLLKEVTQKPIVYTVDPTLLLSRNEWEELCREDFIKEPYVLCYFLKKYPTSRKLCEQYAKQHHLKIVNIPIANNKYRFSDDRFGDMEWNASPEEFLTLIKNAQMIFTDSFHAVVFSNLFEKQYVVFKRGKDDTMSSRISDITRLFHAEDRYCKDKDRESCAYIEGLPKLAYKKNSVLEALIAQSKQFLLENLV